MIVGDRVQACIDIYEEADEHGPTRLLARQGDLLIVRKVGNRPWDLVVSHEHIVDNSFGVLASEVRDTKGGAS